MPDLVEPSPPYSPFRSENNESSQASNTSEPSGTYVRIVTLKYFQLDGACDESPADEEMSPRKRSSSENRPGIHRKISGIGKEAIGKVKDLTSQVAGDLQTKLKGVSPYRASPQRVEQGSPSKQRKQSTDATCVEQTTLDALNTFRGSAANSAFRLTEENIKGLVPGPRPVSHASENSFGSLVVNLPGDRPPKQRKSPTSNPLAQYAGRQSLDAMQDCDADYSKAKLQECSIGLQRKTSTASDATDLQSLRDDPNSDSKVPALQEARNESGAGPSDITNVGKTKAKKQDDESKA
ncbi:hypothetical protein N431DRAFT_119396 [Stipitochalara longipes BDJ]|nr:hypothetical protein N431DRAFT_119396 [Stipitochalara longipes BDJ]